MRRMVRTPTLAAAPHRIRIIGGRWKRTPLVVPEVPGLRPTPDRVRETVFNWLGQTLDGRSCLDLFAGSGALGLEAASRGASHVLCVERDRTACATIRRTLQKLDAPMVDLRESDAERVAHALADAGRTFDVVFLDPPFREGWIARILPLATRLLSDDGALYVESEAALDEATLLAFGLEVERRASAGQVHYHLLRKRAV